jgi:hypothetical protein
VKTQLPESNADIVAVNLVFNAIVNDVHNPGHAIAALLEKMAGFAREIGNVNTFANADWKKMVAEMDLSQPEAKAVMAGHLEAAGDIWAHQWLLCNMAKHLHHQLKKRCDEWPFAAGMKSVEYADDGSVISWTSREQ